MEDVLTHLKTADPVIGRLIDTYDPPHFTPHTNYYEALVSSIISQQLSVKAAATIETRFKTLFGGTFPSPEELITKDIEVLRSAGLSRPKARYMHDLAEKIIDGRVDFTNFSTLSNDTIVSTLVTINGIGEWTAHMFLMFCMGRLDVLPIGDLGIRNGVTKLYHLDHVAAPAEITDIAAQNNWHPYESVASAYVWKSLDNTPAR